MISPTINKPDLKALKALKTLMVLEMETYAMVNIFYKEYKKYEAINIISNKIGWMEDNEDVLNFALPNLWFRGYRYREDYLPYDQQKIDWQRRMGFASKQEKIPEIYR